MTDTKKLVTVAMIAACYVALTLALAPISFGAVQSRISEALSILPVFSFTGVLGVTLGCFLSNLLGMFMGANILGALDVAFGTLATIVAALLSYKTRNIKTFGLPIVSTVFPVIINAVVIGWELYAVTAPAAGFHPTLLLLQMLSVALGQLIPCMVLGPILYTLLNRFGLSKNL